MPEDVTIRVTPQRERRSYRKRSVPRSDTETADFDVGEIRAAMRREDAQVPMLVVTRGLQRGRPIPLRGDHQTIGRSPACDITVQGRGVSRTHARIETTAPDGVVLRDTASTNGVFVNGERIVQRALHDGDVVQLGPETVLRFGFASPVDLALRVRQYEHSIVDDLTGVHNRRFLMESLAHETAFAARHDQPMCLLLIDIDHFKRINDTYGHQAGDVVIQQLARRVAAALRAEDTFARVGGEEFAIVTRGAEGDTFVTAAERIRTRVEAEAIPWQGEQIRCTISIGGTTLRQDGPHDAGALLQRADQNLYRAKQGGRNRVVLD